jgi:hypothetical protein
MGLGPPPDQDDGALQLSTINTGHPQGVAVRRLRAMVTLQASLVFVRANFVFKVKDPCT